KNKNGLLHSIDLPYEQTDQSHPNLPETKETESGDLRWVAWRPSVAGLEVGWLVEEHLRKRWTLELGSSKEKLKPILDKSGSIDMFFHDSEHTYENMIFEYSTAWRYLKPGGFLVSDDVDWNTAFADFAKGKGATGRVISGFGALR